MLEWSEPKGPYILRSAAAYPHDMNLRISEALVRAACAARLRASQANSMVRTCRFGNAFVAKGLFKPHVAGDTTAAPDGAHVTGAKLDTPEHVTVLPEVQQQLPLRNVATEDLGPLYSLQTCVGGFIDTWKSVQRIPGHFTTGAVIAQIMETFLVQHPPIEPKIFVAIGRDDIDPEHMEQRIDPSDKKLRKRCRHLVRQLTLAHLTRNCTLLRFGVIFCMPGWKRQVIQANPFANGYGKVLPRD